MCMQLFHGCFLGWKIGRRGATLFGDVVFCVMIYLNTELIYHVTIECIAIQSLFFFLGDSSSVGLSSSQKLPVEAVVEVQSSKAWVVRLPAAADLKAATAKSSRLTPRHGHIEAQEGWWPPQKCLNPRNPAVLVLDPVISSLLCESSQSVSSGRM